MSRAERLRDRLRELLRFGGVGLAATATHSCIYLFALTIMAPQAANVLGYLCAVLVSYFGHGQITFAAPPPRGKAARLGRVSKFASVSLLGLALNAGFVHLSVNFLETDAWVAVIFIGLATPSVTYILLRLWVFTKTGNPPHG